MVSPEEGTTYHLVATNENGTAEDSIVIQVAVPPVTSNVEAPAVSFSADPVAIQRGQSTTLSWDASNSDTVQLEPNLGSVEPQASRTVTPQGDATYTLVATGPGGTVRHTVNVRVTDAPPPPAAPTASLMAGATTLERGSTTTLTWSSSNATELRLEPGIGVVSAQGSRNVVPDEDVIYRLVATGPGGRVEESVEISVTEPAPVILPEVHDGWMTLDDGKEGCPLQYFPGGSHRQLYCKLVGTFGDVYALAQRLAGMAVFRQGPHTSSQLNLGEQHSFGYYNPEFVAWMVETLVPGADDAVFRASTQPLYDRYLSDLARVAYQIHVKIESDPACFAREVARVRTGLAQRTLAYGDYSRYYYFLDPLFCTSPTPMDSQIYGAVGRQMQSDGPLRSNMTSFWIRRTIDGTADEFYQGLMKLLRTYDSGRIQ